MPRLQRSLIAWLSSVALIASMFAPVAVRAAACTSGTLIKGSSNAVYYCGADGRRYVFPNLKTYSTWYDDFSGVTTVTDQVLASVPIGGNVTYRPGVRLVKITSDPTVYAVGAHGVLRPIASEAVAAALYGSSWSGFVDDVPDAFFVNYRLGTELSSANQFSRGDETSGAGSINGDMELSDSGGNSGDSGVVLSLSPSTNVLAADETVTVSATATDASGVLSVVLYANDIALKTCSDATTSPSKTCTATLRGDGYADGAVVKVSAQALNGDGERHSSSTRELTVEGGIVASSLSLAFSPNDETLSTSKPTTVTVTATDPAGISTVSVYVNGTPFQVCGKDGTVTTATCTATLYASAYPTGSTVAVYGQEVNRDGVPTVSSATSLSVSSGSTDSNYAVIERSPDETTLAIGDEMTFSATAHAPHGVADIAFYVNGTLATTCPASGASSSARCDVDVRGSNYSSGTTVAVYAKATDTDGTTFLSPTSSVTITPGTSDDGTVTLSFSPYASSLAIGQTTTVTASAEDSAGVSSISVYANGSIVKTCTLSGANTTGTCSATLNGSSYPAGSSVAVYGAAVNADDVDVTSSTTTLTITDAVSGDGQVSLFLSPSSGVISGTQVLTVTVNAYDPAGLSSVGVYVNGVNVRSCGQTGTWPTGASCSYSIPANNYGDGTVLSVFGRASNVTGGSTDSSTSTVHAN